MGRQRKGSGPLPAGAGALGAPEVSTGSDAAEAVAEALTALAVNLVRRLPRELSLTSLATLGDLQRCGPQRLTQLAQLEGVAQPSMTALVSRLEEEGLVARSPDPADGRAVLVAITAAGEALLARRRHTGTQLLAARIRELAPAKAERLSAALGALEDLAEMDLAPRHLVPVPGGADRATGTGTSPRPFSNDADDEDREAR
ncbi:MarR family winged helix-turn-helix transcriptional regulator [Aciditerrimonas ferrireducens]|uniref:MarR family winged helix-turn-helix transcriptional regulator n=1 Tax=Aciditerrimonas ferrireducens TaxID=667306 RepID=A0ABV6C6Y5_9ACTN